MVWFGQKQLKGKTFILQSLREECDAAHRTVSELEEKASRAQLDFSSKVGNSLCVIHCIIIWIYFVFNMVQMCM